jgi:hypothetical protein
MHDKRQNTVAPFTTVPSVALNEHINGSRTDKAAEMSAAEGKSHRIDWKKVVTVVDRILFVVSITAIIVTVSVLFPR